MDSLSLIVIVCLIHVDNAIGLQDIFHEASGSHIASIQVQEQKIAEALHSYVASLERRIILTKSYLEEYTEDVEKTEAKSENRISNDTNHSSLSNPLKLFRLIRRLVSSLPRLEKEIHHDFERNLMRTLEVVRKGSFAPTQHDLNSATEGIIRIQDAYELDLLAFTQGNFDGHITNVTLNAADCYTIGSYALSASIFTRAIEWLERAYSLSTKELNKSIAREQVRKKLLDAITQHNNAQGSQYVFEQHVDPHAIGVLTHAQKRMKMLDKRSPRKLYIKEPGIHDLTNFAALCRGEKLQEESAYKRLKCWLDQRTPYTKVAPLRVELLHENPPVFQVYSVLSDTLTDKIIKAVMHSSLSRSKVHGGENESHRKVSASRTSSTSWIHDVRILKRILRVYPQLESLLGLELSPAGCEEFQVSRYHACGHYNPHLDNVVTKEVAPKLDKSEIDKGDRVATMMFYLSDVTKGGMTVFPRLGVAAKPVKGSLLFWFNAKGDGDVEPLSLHGGCPVIFGQKWIANQWIRANSQMFRRKCNKSNTN